MIGFRLLPTTPAGHLAPATGGCRSPFCDFIDPYVEGPAED